MAEAKELSAPTEGTTTAAATQPSSSGSKKKRKKKAPKKHVLRQFTIRSPPWAYVKLERLNSSGTTPPLDEVTAQLYLTAALSQFLGLHGAAIPFDILKLEGQDLWIRLPAEDRGALVAAVGAWVSSNVEGWRIKGWSSWDANATNRESGQEVFVD